MQNNSYVNCRISADERFVSLITFTRTIEALIGTCSRIKKFLHKSVFIIGLRSRRFMGVYLLHPLVCTRFTIHTGPLFKLFSQALADLPVLQLESSYTAQDLHYVWLMAAQSQSTCKYGEVPAIFSKLRHANRRNMEREARDEYPRARSNFRFYLHVICIALFQFSIIYYTFCLSFAIKIINVLFI